MNKRTKILLVLLSAATMCAGAIGIAGCSDDSADTGTHNPEYYAQYQAYAKSQEDAGKSALSYEEWLIDLLGDAKGEAGEAGADGATWLTGEAAPSATQGKNGDFYLNKTTFDVYTKENGVWSSIGNIKGSDGTSGETGVSVKEAEYDEANGQLVLGLSNGSEIKVDLPEHITHKHGYDEKDVKTLIEATKTSDGLGYMVCTDEGCDHIEMVILTKRYLVKIIDVLGDPVEGVEVEINGAKALTDAEGYANVWGYGYKNDYIVSVNKPGFTTSGTVRTDKDPHITIQVGRGLSERSDNYGYTQYFIDEASAYSLTLETGRISDGMEKVDGVWQEKKKDHVYAKEVILCGGETQPKNYKITCPDEKALLLDAEYGGNNLLDAQHTYNKLVMPGEEVKVYFSADTLALGAAGFGFGAEYGYTVKVEEVAVPNPGVKVYPISASANVEIPVEASQADSDGWVYYYWTNPGNDISEVSMTLTGVEAEFTTKEYSMAMGLSDATNPTKVVSDKDMTLVVDPTGGSVYVYQGKYFFRVKPTADGAKFTLNAAATYGGPLNPVEVTTLGVENKFTFEGNDSSDKWYKYNVEAPGQYTVRSVKSGTIEAYDADFTSLGTTESLGVFNFAKAGYYYFRVGAREDAGTVNASFSLSKYNSATDDGYSQQAPVVLGNNGNVEFNDQGNYTFTTVDAKPQQPTYYKLFTATAAGMVSLSAPVDENSYWLSVIVNGMDMWSEAASVGVGDVVMILAENDSNADKFAVTVNFTAESSSDETKSDVSITVKDETGAPIANQKVQVKNANEVIAEGTTDDKGVVKNAGAFLNFTLGSYSIEFPELDTDTYLYYDKQSTDSSKTAYEVTLYAHKKQYNVTVQSGATKFEGATVNAKDGAGKVFATGTTNAQGVAEISVFDVFKVASITLEAVPAGDDAKDYAVPSDKPVQITEKEKNQTDWTLELVAKVAYSVTLKYPNGAPVAGATAKINRAGGNSSYVALDSAETDADGKATLKAAPYEYVITFEDLPAGYNAPEVITAAEAMDKTVTLGVGDKAVSGVGSVMQAQTVGNTSSMVTGLNSCTNLADDSYYTFSAADSALYTFTLTDGTVAAEDDKSYISYLQVGETVLIDNGREIAVDYDLVLGLNRAMNKTAVATLKLGMSDKVIIGINTEADEAALSYVTITSADSGVVDLAEGAAQLNTQNGHAEAHTAFEVACTISSTAAGVTVYVDGVAYTLGEEISAGPHDVVVYSDTADTVEITVALIGGATGGKN